MDKNSENNIAKILVMIIVITMAFVVLLFSGKLDFIINKSIRNNNITENDDHDINQFLNEMTKPLGWLVVRHTYSQYANREGINYLSFNEDKEVLTFEYIISKNENVQNFIVLNSTDDTIIESNPQEEYTKAYYPYTLFNEEYKKLFNEDFDINIRIVANNSSNEYDNSSDYVYYPNSHPGANDMYVESIELIDMKYDKDTAKYTINVNMTYSEKLASDTGMKHEKAQIIYHLNEGNIIMESFIVGTDF